jgi:hypothetical protein
MIIDATAWEVWDNQALTSVEVSHTNGTLLDLEELGVTDTMLPLSLILNIQVGTVFATLTSGVMIMVITSDSETFASGNIPLAGIGCTTYPLPAASLAAKARFSIAFQAFTLHKYLGIVWEPVSEAATGGTLDAWFALSPISKCGRTQKMPSGYTA